jgi:putative NIF3 family GTP cyclohydrolase 1 type 2
MNAIELLGEMQTHLGVPWQSQNAGAFSDGVLAGSPEIEVTGVITSFAATMEVLRRAVSSGNNTVVCREPPFYSHGEIAPTAYRSGPEPSKELLAKDAVYIAKSEYIRSNKLVVMRFRDNWDARKIDGQLAGLTKALGWDSSHLPTIAPKNSYRPGNNYFQIPTAPLGTVVRHIQTSLHARSIRVLGDQAAPIRKVALLPGYILIPDLQAAYAHGPIDLVVAGEAVEWEGVEYLQDMIAAKRTKAAILLGSEVSEEPGSGEMAAWLKTFLKIPVEWIPAGEPFHGER